MKYGFHDVDQHPLRAWQQHWEPSVFAGRHHLTHRVEWRYNSQCDEEMNEGLPSVDWKRPANGTELHELEEAALHDTVHVILHRQLAVNDDSKVADGVERRLSLEILANRWREPSQMNWVLAPFNFSRFDVIHRLMASMQSVILDTVEAAFFSEPLMYICVSSA